MRSVPPSPQDVALDACVLINLVGSGVDIGAISAAAGMRFHVTAIVAAETHHLVSGDGRVDRRPIDVQAIAEEGHLGLIPLVAADLDRFVSLARELDDGEASVIAIAASRRWTVATDDRRALRVAARLGLDLVGTPYLLNRWAKSAEAETVGAALLNVESRARFKPRADDPHRNWWDEQRSQCSADPVIEET